MYRASPDTSGCRPHWSYVAVAVWIGRSRAWAVLPAHGVLNRDVKVPEGVVGRHLDAAPCRRLDVLEPDLELEHPGARAPGRARSSGDGHAKPGPRHCPTRPLGPASRVGGLPRLAAEWYAAGAG